MSKERALVLTALFVLLLAAVAAASAAGDDELAEVRTATAPFHRPEAAQDGGWDLVPGLDYCFENPGVGAMGYHYINGELLADPAVDAAQPEAMVYAPGPNGRLQLAAVEYIVPADSVTGEPPSLFGQSFHLNSALGVYVLHAWIWRPNPAGSFEDWNPNVSCP